MQINKTKIIELYIADLTNKLSVAINAAEQAKATATHSDSVARSKYETFGLEASYLAHGQSVRAQQLIEQLAQIKQLNIRQYPPNMPIAIGSLVEIINQSKQVKLIFIAVQASGQVNYEGQTITLISKATPLAQALLGQQLGDEIVVAGVNEKINYQILACY
ncbi:GreA/GreB family elongation factor [Paraferrimonas sp. SM1919]|uniref:GreA/GreB family elongation factor n=1 Tax=Paraferrimonas sp. SM1919 TaxID=2662263 RepID=UPI0013D0B64B|nr:GreA/GreB family elongation factor [Paraferrimonas sp. SM1919]